MDLTPAVAAALDLPDGWPLTRKARAAACEALRVLDRVAWVELVRAAYHEARGSAERASPAAWSAILGVSVATIHRWRRGVRHGVATGRRAVEAVPELRDLRVTTGGRAKTHVSNAARQKAYRARQT